MGCGPLFAGKRVWHLLGFATGEGRGLYLKGTYEERAGKIDADGRRLVVVRLCF